MSLTDHPRIQPTSDEGEHIVQFYDDDALLIEEIGRTLCVALDQGHGAVCIATARHQQQLERQVEARGIDAAAAKARGQYVPLDAAEMLDQITRDGSPDPVRFEKEIGAVLDWCSARYPRVWIFGEMVALMCASGNYGGALELETLWCTLATARPFWLSCAYPSEAFLTEQGTRAFAEVCDQHCRILHSDSSLALSVRRGPRATSAN